MSVARERGFDNQNFESSKDFGMRFSFCIFLLNQFLSVAFTFQFVFSLHKEVV